MKKTFKKLLICLFTGAVLFISCRKTSPDSVYNGNKPPIAVAGPDQVIFLPADSAVLDGNASTDLDYNIISYLWSKISGPSSFNISNAFTAKTQVVNLIEGIYQFELKVTDAGGHTSKDTVGVRVVPGGTMEIIISDLVWINLCYQNLPGACWINGDSPSYGFKIIDTTGLLPDTANAIAGVWVKMDTSSVWEPVPKNCWVFPDSYPQSNFTYCLSSDSLSVYSWFLSLENLEGRKADVRVRF